MSTTLWGRGGSYYHSIRWEVTQVQKTASCLSRRGRQSWNRIRLPGTPELSNSTGGRWLLRLNAKDCHRTQPNCVRQGLLGRPIQFRYIHHCCLERILSENEKPREEQNQTKPRVSAGLGTGGRERFPFIPSVCQGSAWMHKGLPKFGSEEDRVL